MNESRYSIGLDIGALAIKAAVSDASGAIRSFYRLHHGEPEEQILKLVRELGDPAACAVTGTGGRRTAEALGLLYVDPAVALTAALDEKTPARHIVDIGGGSLSIVDLDEEGRFSGFRTNSLCAAGTGSFLDEQAVRMKLAEEEKGLRRDIADPPRIAARCAVFAKSDLIHRQQEGFTIPEMWSGLCRGMVGTALSTLFRGRKPAGAVLVAGGVARNLEVLRWLENELDAEIIVPNDPESFSARGALRCARQIKEKVDWDSICDQPDEGEAPRRPALKLDLTDYPDFACSSLSVEEGVEIRLHGEIGAEAAIGIDIGSTSTKAVLVDMGGRVTADFYCRTAGNPIAATQRILAAAGRAAAGSKLHIRAAGTTGSGRKMIGAVIGADRVINEITAHVRGAKERDPDVETIFEIGGQDAKFVSLKDGAPHDSNMNYVCAAGTGSFVEEQAAKLGFKLTEIGDAVMGERPPFSSDRCTVFMEQDVHALIRRGYRREEVMGSVLYSVVQNYLNRVVGRRPYSGKKICFMGATARNRGLVAAFEKLLGLPISVSPFCHVMGALGVALIALEEVALKNKPSSFRGLEFANESVELGREECRLCANYCRITTAQVAPARPASGTHECGRGEARVAGRASWGYMCGRDPAESRVRVNPFFEPMRARDKVWRRAVNTAPSGAPVDTVGMPLALLNHTYLPFWKGFFNRLGVEVKLSGPTGEGTLAQAQEYIGADYCYPVKLAHGHIRELAADPEVDHIFLPYVVQGEPHDDGFSRSVFCPYNIAFPSIVKTAGLFEDEQRKILKPVLNFQWREELVMDSLAKELTPALGAERSELAAAWRAAHEAQAAYTEGIEQIGREALEKIESGNGRGVVILGRPYNVYDAGANLGLTQKIADLGFTVLTLDMLPVRSERVDPLFNNMYWRYGRRMLQAAGFIARHPRLNAVLITNFGCGPDSFLQTYVEHVMKGKPMLMLELDEHSADAGYITRLEAFRDVIAGEPGTRSCDPAPRSPREEPRIPSPESRVPSPETLWLPPMHPYGAPLLAAALRSMGTNAQPMPPETVESFSRAKAFCRGTECVPAPATIGAFLDVLARSEDPGREVLFMPSAKGPCRFGQYHTLQRLILDQAGYCETRIEAWSDESGSYGLGPRASRRLYNSMVAADLLFKARCRLRPYAADRAAFDAAMEEEVASAVRAAESGRGLKGALARSAQRLATVPITDARKPLVGVVGEIYVRSNPFTNGELVETIEEAGGEAWVAPVTEWFQYLSFMDTIFGKEEKAGLLARIGKDLKNAYMMRRGRTLAETMSRVIGDRPEPSIESTIVAGERYMPRRFDGESILTVGRAIEFAKDGVSLIVNVAPFGCMPGTLTAGIFERMEGHLGVPVVSLFFDGEADLRHIVRTYITNICAERAAR